MKTKLLLLLSFMFFVACGSGKTTPSESDEDSVPDIRQDETQDEAQDDTIDTVSDVDSDEMVDEDVAPTITISCPESVDETEGSAICTITSTSEHIQIVDHNCHGDLQSNEKTYTITLSEQLAPIVCTVSIVNSDTDEIATANIIVNEVNEAPLMQAEIEMLFYEGVLKDKNIVITDPDLPRDATNDPGFFKCFIKDNSCGDWITVTKIDYQACKVSGMMPEMLTDGECSFTFVVEDGYGAKTERTVATELREKNDAPVWTSDTAPISLLASTNYNEINGVATDTDLPNAIDGNPGFVSCVHDSDSCSFDVSVTTERVGGEASCRVSFTAGDVTENCRLYYHITDGENNVAAPVPVTIEVTASVSIDCPESINEGEEIVCDITAIGGDPTVQAWSENSCHGAISKEGDAWKYRYTTTEADGPKICDAAIAIGSVLASESVEIKEVNQPPTLWFTNSSGITVDPAIFEATEGTNIFINAKFADSDMPQIATTDPGFVSCEIKNNSCGSWLLFNAANCMGSGAPDETAGGTECSYTVEVTDGYGATVSETVHITIAEYNVAPYFDSSSNLPDLTLMTGEYYSFVFTIKDNDLPNVDAGDPGYVYCKNIVQSHTYPIASDISITGEGAGSAECRITITAMENITTYYHIADSFTVSIEDGFDSSRSDSMTIVLRKCVFYTTPDATGIDGRTWDDAMPMSQIGTHAWRGCEIWAKQGVYSPPTDDGASVLDMTNGVAIIGGFGGYEDPHASDDWRRHRPDPLVHSVLDGEDTAGPVAYLLSDDSIDGFIIKNGNASGGGGGISAAGFNGNLLIKNTVFENNRSTGDGGALYVYGDEYGSMFLRCEQTKFVNHTKSAVVLNSVPATFIKAQFIGNSGYRGGAIRLYGYKIKDSLTVENSLFYNNSATLGGSIDSRDIPIQINFSTFVYNQDDAGNAFYYDALSDREITNCIFWNNGAGTSDAISYSYVEGISGGVGNISSMPPTTTMFIDEANDDFHLNPTSPVIDAADPEATLADDLDGNDRPQGTGWDMGAYEYSE